MDVGGEKTNIVLCNFQVSAFFGGFLKSFNMEVRKITRNISRDQTGQEPTVMKILVGVILIAIALGIGVTVYQRFGSAATSYLDYSVNVTPGSDTVSSENELIVEVDVRTEVGYEENVTLRDKGTPENVAINFNPSSGNPTFGSTMNLEVGSEALPGTHTITIKAESGDTEKTATYKLTIPENR